MRERGGRIVNVSSRGAFRGEPASPAYGASKAGLNALGQSLAVALAPYGIAVATVAPGFVATDMTNEHLHGERGAAIRAQSPFDRVARPEEIAAAVHWLAVPAGRVGLRHHRRPQRRLLPPQLTPRAHAPTGVAPVESASRVPQGQSARDGDGAGRGATSGRGGWRGR